jgi:ribosome-binding protein aMBF1 (putative translation factor)
MSTERVPEFYDGQDWTLVTVKRKKKPEEAKQGSADTKKPIRPFQRKQPLEASQARKLEESTIAHKPKNLTSESRQMIVNLRTAQSWTQAKLNIECRFPVNTIREIEAGRLCPSVPQLNMLNKVLKCGLKYEQ